MKRKRKNYLSEEKVAILKRHLVDKIPVSDLCDEYSLHPTVFYRWQKEFFEHGAAAFEKESARKKNREADRIRALEQKLQRKNEVLSELMEEHLKLKKNLGEI
jgi:transposase